MNTNFLTDCLVAIALIVLLALGMKLAGVNEPLDAFHAAEAGPIRIDDEGTVWVPRSFFKTDFHSRVLNADAIRRGDGNGKWMELR